MKIDHPQAHRQACLKLVLGLLAVWFSASFGCGILFREWLDANAPQIGNAPFGFWMAQQGAMSGPLPVAPMQLVADRLAIQRACLSRRC